MKKVSFFLAIVFLSSLAALAQQNGRDNSAGSGMMGGEGYRSGSEMMGSDGNGMNTGIMGQGYSQSPECQKFYEDTVSLRKELHEKKFEYFETQRNSRAPRETSGKLDTEIKKLQEKISAKAPAECTW